MMVFVGYNVVMLCLHVIVWICLLVNSFELADISKLTQFENCLRNLSNVQNSIPLWAQPQCLEWKPQEEYCNLGFGHLGDGTTLAAGSVMGARGGDFECRTRGIDERHTLHKHCDADCSQANHLALVRFMEAMKAYQYYTVYFLGDSVSVQLAHFAACDFLRDTNSTIKVDLCPDDTYKPMFTGDRKKGCNIIRHFNNNGAVLHKITIKSVRSDPPCNGNKCAGVHRDVAGEMTRWFTESAFSRSWHKTLIVFNSGLHISNYEGRVLQEIARGMARGLLVEALHLAEVGSSVVWRESSAQHFSYSDDGHYMANYSLASSTKHNEAQSFLGFCCDYTPYPSNRTLSREDEVLITALSHFRRDWRTAIGWAKYYEHSNAIGADMHIERGDCTHFVYDPGGAGRSLSNYLLESVVDAVSQLHHHRKLQVL